MKRWKTVIAIFAGSGLILGSTAALSGVAAGNMASQSTGPTIKIMNISQTTETSGVGTTTPGAPAGAKARATRANKTKELPGGAQIQVISCDDKDDANAAAACAQQAVSQGVVAIIGDASQHGDVIDPVLAQAGIALIGEDPLSLPDYSSKISFPLQGGTPGYVAGALIQAQKASIKKVDLAYLGNAAGAAVPALAGMAKVAGVTLGHSTPVPPSSPDLTSTVQASASGVNGIVLATLPPSAAQFIQTAKQQNVTLPIISSNSGFTNATLKQLGGTANGVQTNNAYNLLTSNAPGIKQFLSDMKKYAPGVQVEDQYGLGAWLGMDVFISMLKQQKLTNATAASVLQGMGSLTNLSTGNVIPPLTTTTPFASALFPRIFNEFTYPGVIKSGKNTGTGQPFNAMVAYTTGG
jgi:ABC-type branched-subunit amino acid transport system substrate-binding protein